MISSILAGYAWDERNPFVSEPRRRLRMISELCARDVNMSDLNTCLRRNLLEGKA